MIALKFNFLSRMTRLVAVEIWVSRDLQSSLSMSFGSLDGIPIKIAKTSTFQAPNASSYYNRKKEFQYFAQVSCDSFYRIKLFSCVSPASTYDRTVYEMISAFGLLKREEGALPRGSWVVFDDYYVCPGILWNAWPSENLCVPKELFNYWKSSPRKNTEKEYGMMIGRWGVLQRPIRVTFRKKPSFFLCFACFKFHN